MAVEMSGQATSQICTAPYVLLSARDIILPKALLDVLHVLLTLRHQEQLHLQSVRAFVKRGIVAMPMVEHVRHVHAVITRAVLETLLVPRQQRVIMQLVQVIQAKPRPMLDTMRQLVRVHRRRVQRTRPVRRDRMHVQTVHVMQAMVAMQQQVRVQSVQRVPTSLVQAMPPVEHVLRDITVPVVQTELNAQQTHPVQQDRMQ